ncbi:MAG: molybdenum cofactor guanylyltransferase [FCB group bacterium]|jgi:molybdopterin-guanine dinucleotide biosynthesis protein A
MYRDITGIILSGGKSTRMGQNKSFLKLGKKTVIENICILMKSIFENVIIITNEPEKYQFLNVKCYEDIFKDYGPIGGIHSGLKHSYTDNNFIISCDLPLITKEIINYIINYDITKEIVITRADGFTQQLCGLYNKKVLPLIERIISVPDEKENRNNIQGKRKCRVLTLIERSNATIIDIEKEFAKYIKGSFLNLNNPEDYKFIVDSGFYK